MHATPSPSTITRCCVVSVQTWCLLSSPIPHDQFLWVAQGQLTWSSQDDTFLLSSLMTGIKVAPPAQSMGASCPSWILQMTRAVSEHSSLRAVAVVLTCLDLSACKACKENTFQPQIIPDFSSTWDSMPCRPGEILLIFSALFVVSPVIDPWGLSWKKSKWHTALYTKQHLTSTLCPSAGS